MACQCPKSALPHPLNAYHIIQTMYQPLTPNRLAVVTDIIWPITTTQFIIAFPLLSLLWTALFSIYIGIPVTNPGIFWLVLGMNVLTALILSCSSILGWLWVHGLAMENAVEWDGDEVWVIGCEDEDEDDDMV